MYTKEQKMKEVMRAAKELRTQKKQINKNNINRTVDKNIVDYAFITGLNLGHIEKELIKETRKNPLKIIRPKKISQWLCV